MSANRLLFSALVALVIATTAFLWVAGADPQAMQMIASFLAFAAGVALLEWLDGRSSLRDPKDPTATCIRGMETGASDRG